MGQVGENQINFAQSYGKQLRASEESESDTTSSDEEINLRGATPAPATPERLHNHSTTTDSMATSANAVRLSGFGGKSPTIGYSVGKELPQTEGADSDESSTQNKINLHRGSEAEEPSGRFHDYHATTNDSALGASHSVRPLKSGGKSPTFGFSFGKEIRPCEESGSDESSSSSDDIRNSKEIQREVISGQSQDHPAATDLMVNATNTGRPSSSGGKSPSSFDITGKQLPFNSVESQAASGHDELNQSSKSQPIQEARPQSNSNLTSPKTLLNKDRTHKGTKGKRRNTQKNSRKNTNAHPRDRVGNDTRKKQRARLTNQDFNRTSNRPERFANNPVRGYIFTDNKVDYDSWGREQATVMACAQSTLEYLTENPLHVAPEDNTALTELVNRNTHVDSVDYEDSWAWILPNKEFVKMMFHLHQDELRESLAAEITEGHYQGDAGGIVLFTDLHHSSWITTSHGDSVPSSSQVDYLSWLTEDRAARRSCNFMFDLIKDSTKYTNIEALKSFYQLNCIVDKSQLLNQDR